MKNAMRGAAALCLAAACAVAVPALAQVSSLEGERAQVSYMVGMDVGQSIAPVGPDIDYAALERSIRNAFEGGEPLLSEQEVAQTAQALMQRVALRNGQTPPGMPPGTPPPEVDREKVGLMVGADIGRSLLPIRGEFDLPVLIQGLRTRVEGGEPLLDQARADALRQAFSARVQKEMEAEAARAGERNRAEGEAFLAENRTRAGVQATASGLQYMVVRQGSGRRPVPSDRVRVHYEGKLLDGTVFDSSYERAQPAEFGLNQVIPGWTEGVALMPIGSKYRFWIPGHLGYGAQGTQGIPPNSTLVFDVELLDIL
ncbi:FKBP-type peptidyl-prolyl cis-trans isomerase [Luteimonas huabeiensis]|uniref:FKBP-type peptidyl-prolyl cis-trans isomerase n=1 Tax=Luteimonas huabeiensis TaxID=1244513 RepID=UPI000465CB2E|nr:FKBP-type peptidyl-prolyl cis-trans isomerase [Luteimonas huabeiensis]